MKQVHLWGILLFTLISCNSNSPELEEALDLAGNNRSELESVLHYYQKRGKVAYQSACFLISNMKYHESKDVIHIDSSYNRYFVYTDSLYRSIFGDMTICEQKQYKGKEFDSLRRSLGNTFNTLPNPEITAKARLSDLQSIKADYLINNIDEALKIWKTKGYTYNKDFDFFKEFILPYRTTNEFPSHTRSEIRSLYETLLIDTISNLEKLERYKVYVSKCRWINHYTKPKGHIGIYDLFVPKFKMDCHNMTNWSCNVLRACGIPTAYEFTPKWTDRDNRHFGVHRQILRAFYSPILHPTITLEKTGTVILNTQEKYTEKLMERRKTLPIFWLMKMNLFQKFLEHHY